MEIMDEGDSLVGAPLRVFVHLRSREPQDAPALSNQRAVSRLVTPRLLLRALMEVMAIDLDSYSREDPRHALGHKRPNMNQREVDSELEHAHLLSKDDLAKVKEARRA